MSNKSNITIEDLIMDELSEKEMKTVVGGGILGAAAGAFLGAKYCQDLVKGVEKEVCAAGGALLGSLLPVL